MYLIQKNVLEIFIYINEHLYFHHLEKLLIFFPENLKVCVPVWEPFFFGHKCVSIVSNKLIVCQKGQECAIFTIAETHLLGKSQSCVLKNIEGTRMCNFYHCRNSSAWQKPKLCFKEYLLNSVLHGGYNLYNMFCTACAKKELRICCIHWLWLIDYDSYITYETYETYETYAI